jgi:hypothetical protein
MRTTAVWSRYSSKISHALQPSVDIYVKIALTTYVIVGDVPNICNANRNDGDPVGMRCESTCNFCFGRGLFQDRSNTTTATMSRPTTFFTILSHFTNTRKDQYTSTCLSRMMVLYEFQARVRRPAPHFLIRHHTCGCPCALKLSSRHKVTATGTL